jgi:hypothetical protein
MEGWREQLSEGGWSGKDRITRGRERASSRDRENERERADERMSIALTSASDDRPEGRRDGE